MSKIKVWMFWWNTCPMHKVMPREYLKDGMTVLEKKMMRNSNVQIL